MARDKLSRKFKAKPNKEQWNTICPLMEYRVINGNEADSLGIIPPGMPNVNCVIVGASGSTIDTIMYFANYCRIDGCEIDQEPYIELYSGGSMQPSLYGIIHHANFNGRTETLTERELAKITASGASADIQFTAKPENKSGTLEELRTQGKLIGFEYALEKGTNDINHNY